MLKCSPGRVDRQSHVSRETLRRQHFPALARSSAVSEWRNRSMSNGKTTVTWLGHASFLFETPDGQRILLDPWIDGNPAFPVHLKDQVTTNLDAILLTHGHFDHTGSVVAVAKESGAKIACIFDLGAWL